MRVMAWFKSESRKGEESTIRTESGKEITGKIVYETKYAPDDLIEEIFVGLATCGVGPILTRPDDKTTVVNSKGNYWTGKEEDC
jgi:hypothetical protein